MYQEATKRYHDIAVDTEQAMGILAGVPLSIHCWQGDDVAGFDSEEALSGGIQATGNYPGKANSPAELMADLDLVLSLIPGRKKLNLHASYAIFAEGEQVGRNELRPEHFEGWVDFAKKHDIGLDFNPTYFAHPMVRDNLTLSSPDEETRRYWIDHTKCCIAIAEYFAMETGQPCLMNIWIPDGYKNIPADRLGPRARFKASLDEILTVPCDRGKVKISLESKVFGIGLESYTVGSSEFCLGYAAANGLVPLVDNGHYHPTELVSDKLSSLLLFFDEIALHVTRPVRWDSDHVVLFDDETREIARELVTNDALGRVYIGTDFFDASINRLAAWVTGLRSVQKALLFALLQPHDAMREMQDREEHTQLMVLQEELKTLPFGAVWEEYLARSGVAADYISPITAYEQKVLVKR